MRVLLFIYLFLPSFAGMHHAPGNARLQTHVHATSRTPQLHQRGCMAHPKNKKRVGGGGERVFLNNSSFGQHREGCRGETICVVTRPLGEKRAHTMRRLEEGTEELSALRVWGRRAARRGGAEWSAGLSNHRPSTGEPHRCGARFPKLRTDYSSLVTTSRCSCITL